MFLAPTKACFRVNGHSEWGMLHAQGATSPLTRTACKKKSLVRNVHTQALRKTLLISMCLAHPCTNFHLVFRYEGKPGKVFICGPIVLRSLEKGFHFLRNGNCPMAPKILKHLHSVEALLLIESRPWNLLQKKRINFQICVTAIYNNLYIDVSHSHHRPTAKLLNHDTSSESTFRIKVEVLVLASTVEHVIAIERVKRWTKEKPQQKHNNENEACRNIPPCTEHLHFHFLFNKPLAMLHPLSGTGLPEEPNVPHHVPLQGRTVHAFIYPVSVCVWSLWFCMTWLVNYKFNHHCTSDFFIVEMSGRKDRKTGKSDALIHML